MTDNNKTTTGGCLCGSVRYKVKGPLRNIIHCHCSMCQRLHGSSGAHSKALKENIEITKDNSLTWFKSSELAQRGFCNKCGSNLFWAPFSQDSTGIVAGTLDAPVGLKSIGHIFVAGKANFYNIEDNLPQFEGSSNGKLANDYK